MLLYVYILASSISTFSKDYSQHVMYGGVPLTLFVVAIFSCLLILP